MSKFVIPAAKPYVDALFLIYQEDTKVRKDMIRIVEILTEIEPLAEYLASQKINAKTKKDFVKKIFEKEISNISLNFLFLLIDKKRINILFPIIQKYIELHQQKLSIMTCRITTVIPISSMQLTMLASNLQVLFNYRVVNLEAKEDPTILGGLLVEGGGQFIDLSVNGQLRSISNSLGNDFEF